MVTANENREFARKLRKNMTEAERLLWYQLKARRLGGFVFRRQFHIGPYIADFVCRQYRLIVEVDGATHSTDRELASDEKRETYLIGKGWQVLRVGNEDIYRAMDDVTDHIYRYLLDQKPKFNKRKNPLSPLVGELSAQRAEGG